MMNFKKTGALTLIACSFLTSSAFSSTNKEVFPSLEDPHSKSAPAKAAPKPAPEKATPKPAPEKAAPKPAPAKPSPEEKVGREAARVVSQVEDAAKGVGAGFKKFRHKHKAKKKEGN